MKLKEIQDLLNEKKIKVFSDLELGRLLGISKPATHRLIVRYTKRGIFLRLRRGLYAIKNKLPSVYFMANHIYSPSYVSFETALSYYNLIPEVVYAVTSATTKVTRKFGVGETSFIYHKIKRKAYTGYRLMQIGDEKMLLAEKEKALADYLYYVHLGKKSLNDRLSLREIDFKKLIYFADLFGRSRFIKWIENDIRRIN